MTLDFILSVMEAKGEVKTEEWPDLIYNFKLSLWLQLENRGQEWKSEGNWEKLLYSKYKLKQEID